MANSSSSLLILLFTTLWVFAQLNALQVKPAWPFCREDTHCNGWCGENPAFCVHRRCCCMPSFGSDDYSIASSAYKQHVVH